MLYLIKFIKLKPKVKKIKGRMKIFPFLFGKLKNYTYLCTIKIKLNN